MTRVHWRKPKTRVQMDGVTIARVQMNVVRKIQVPVDRVPITRV